MAIKVFLDANVILDYLLKRNGYEDAKEIFLEIETFRVKGYITSSVLHIVAYWTNKTYGVDLTKKLLIALLSQTTVIDITQSVAVTAVGSQMKDIEDALQYHTAIHHKIHYFISRDRVLQSESQPLLPVKSPGEFITLLG